MNRYKLHAVRRVPQIYVKFKEEYLNSVDFSTERREMLRRMRGVVTQLDYSGERVMVDWGSSAVAENNKWVIKAQLVYE